MTIRLGAGGTASAGGSHTPLLGATVEEQRQAYNWYSVDDGGVHFQSLWTALQAATR